MIVKLTKANDEFEFFETNEYAVSTIKDLHPLIVKLEIYDNGKKIFAKSRKNKWFYKKFTFNTVAVQEQLKMIAAQRNPLEKQLFENQSEVPVVK